MQLDAQAAALVGAKRGRGDKEVDEADPGDQVAPGVLKRRVINPHRPAVNGTAAAENISQVGRAMMGQGRTMRSPKHAQQRAALWAPSTVAGASLHACNADAAPAVRPYAALPQCVARCPAL